MMIVKLIDNIGKGVSLTFISIVVLFFLFLAYFAFYNLFFMKQIVTQYNNFPCQNQTILTNEPKSIYMDEDYALESYNDITRNWLLTNAPATKAKQIKYYPRGSTMKIIGMYNVRNKGQMFTEQSSSAYLLETNDTHKKAWLSTYQVDTNKCTMVNFIGSKQSTKKDYNITSTVVETTNAISLMFK